MALVVAVIMIVIFLGISGSDSLSKRGAMRSIKDEIALETAFEQTYTDKKFEDAFQKIIYYPSVDYNRNDLWNELSEIFAKIPSCRNISESFLNSLCLSKYGFEYRLVLSMLLANRGKVEIKSLFCGALLTEGKKTIYIRAAISEEDGLWRKRGKDILTWTEQELHRHGVPVDLMVIYGGKEMLWRDYRDPSKVGELDDGIWGFRWAYSAQDDTPIKETLNRQKNEIEQRVLRFEDHFVDPAMEIAAREYIRNVSHYPELIAYLQGVLSNTPYEKYVVDDLETFIETDRHQVLEIIMASKGKLTRAGATIGYSAEIYSNDRELQLRCFAYAKTISILVRDSGLNIMLNGDKDAYVWSDSAGDNGNLKPFSTKFIDPQ